jgi:hypothetical protein
MTRRVKSCDYTADNETRLVILAVRRHVDEGATACCAFKQNGIVIMLNHGRRPAKVVSRCRRLLD